MSSNALGEALRQRRLELGLSLQATSELTKRPGEPPVHFAVLSKIERGVHNPSLRMIARIAQGYGMTTREVARLSVADETVPA